MKRGQAQVFWVLLEFVLVIAASYGMDRLIDRARDNELPEQNYAAIETAFTRQSLDLYAQSTAYYEQFIPGVQLKSSWPFSLKKGELKIGSAQVTYGYDTTVKDGIPDTNPDVGLHIGVSNRIVNASLKHRVSMNTLAVPCSPTAIPRKIAILPADKDASELAIQLINEGFNRNPAYLPQSSQVASLFDRTNEQVLTQRKQFIDSADAVIIIARSSTTKQAVAYHNVAGTSLACSIINGIVPLQDAFYAAEFSAASVPVIKLNLPANHPAQELPDNKPAILLVISSDQNAIAAARSIHATLK